MRMMVAASVLIELLGLGGCAEDSGDSAPSMTISEFNDPMGIDTGPETVVFSDFGISGDVRDASWNFQGSAGAGEYFNLAFEAGSEGTIRERDYPCTMVPYSLRPNITHKGTPYPPAMINCTMTVIALGAVGETVSISFTGEAMPYLNDHVTISAHLSAVRQ